MSKTRGEWDKPVFGGFPIGLYIHPVGANRRARRQNREHQDDPMPPSSMVPVKKVIDEEGEVQYVASH